MDGIPPVVLKNCRSSLSGPLSRLFHLSYSSGFYPSAWKIANVQPVPKKGSRSDTSNYRPIAVTSILTKIMERIIKHNLMDYPESNGLIHDSQYGFRSKRSTGDVMAYLTEVWSHSLHSFRETQAIALDFSKAFDRVWHANLFSKLSAFGVDPSLYRWTESFLSKWSIQVVLDGVISERHDINANVPQGSVLSPVLFLIYINDLFSLTYNSIHGFADDSNPHHSYKFSKVPKKEEVAAARKAMVDTLSLDVSLGIWGDGIWGDGICERSNLKMLGISINDKMLWYEHVLGVTMNAAKRLGFLRRCKKYFSPNELAVIYKVYNSASFGVRFTFVGRSSILNTESCRKTSKESFPFDWWHDYYESNWLARPSP